MAEIKTQEFTDKAKAAKLFLEDFFNAQYERYKSLVFKDDFWFPIDLTTLKYDLNLEFALNEGIDLMLCYLTPKCMKLQVVAPHNVLTIAEYLENKFTGKLKFTELYNQEKTSTIFKIDRSFPFVADLLTKYGINNCSFKINGNVDLVQLDEYTIDVYVNFHIHDIDFYGEKIKEINF